jgi:hypothetical protein
MLQLLSLLLRVVSRQPPVRHTSSITSQNTCDNNAPALSVSLRLRSVLPRLRVVWLQPPTSQHTSAHTPVCVRVRHVCAATPPPPLPRRVVALAPARPALLCVLLLLLLSLARSQTHSFAARQAARATAMRRLESTRARAHADASIAHHRHCGTTAQQHSLVHVRCQQLPALHTRAHNHNVRCYISHLVVCAQPLPLLGAVRRRVPVLPAQSLRVFCDT